MLGIAYFFALVLSIVLGNSYVYNYFQKIIAFYGINILVFSLIILLVVQLLDSYSTFLGISMVLKLHRGNINIAFGYEQNKIAVRAMYRFGFKKGLFISSVKIYLMSLAIVLVLYFLSQRVLFVFLFFFCMTALIAVISNLYNCLKLSIKLSNSRSNS